MKTCQFSPMDVSQPLLLPHSCRQYDRERYACNLHAPHAARAGLFALHAFNLETIKIGGAMSDAAAGTMRFAWWRETVGKCLAGRPPEHPVAEALAHVHAATGLTPRYLTQLLDAREADFHLQQPRDLGELSTYAERTSGALLLLGLEVSGDAGCDSAERAASHAGTALGLLAVLRGTAAHAAQRCCYLPAEVTARHGVDLARALQGQPSFELSAAVAEVAGAATAHLLAARAMQPGLGTAARTVLLPATVADLIGQTLHAHACALACLPQASQCFPRVLLSTHGTFHGRYSPFEPGVREPLGAKLQLALLWRRLSSTY
jgi:phytoene/squalene synthetase